MENGSSIIKQELALWVWNVAGRSPALEQRWLAQLASSGNFQRFLAGFLGLGWLAGFREAVLWVLPGAENSEPSQLAPTCGQVGR